MTEARATLKDLGVGQQDVLVWITKKKPEIDHLTLATRWRNAWGCKNADPEFTELVEQAAENFRKQKETSRKRLGQQRLRAKPEHQ